ncbi:Putative Flp pilus-assembly TadE/G-like [Thermanaeromonas toyohensis ToBE]|uniref:Putative Flp pilus-assembly TadE/G-like n=2 Tax=Thermanaeromonas TaxID=202949 RepID=A0A1W1VTQ8_9FIRM|nr:Putative Flp pilus-assembly TadE/G-like [Thermanaeromonas toyohensis ToBE]
MVMLWAAAWVICLMGMAALVLDLGRVMAVKEQLQTSVDAGSLAASMHGIRYVKVLVPDRWKRVCDICCGEKGCYCCNCQYYRLSDYLAEGRKDYVWDRSGWYRMAGCGSCGRCCRVYCGRPQVVEQWVQFPGDTVAVARQVVELNLPDDMKPPAGGGVSSVAVEVHSGVAEKQSEYATHSDPLAPSVVVKAAGWMRSLLAGGLWKVDRLEVQSCGQSGVFFLKLGRSGQQTANLNPRPEPG